MRMFAIFLCAQKTPITGAVANLYDDITIILPTLNEEKNISSILAYIASNYKDCRIIVADDGSRDRTKKIALDFKYKNLIFLDRSKQLIHGLTASVLDAIKLIKTKYFVVMDADGQHPPKKIKEIVNILRLDSNLVNKNK